MNNRTNRRSFTPLDSSPYYHAVQDIYDTVYFSLMETATILDNLVLAELLRIDRTPAE